MRISSPIHKTALLILLNLVTASAALSNPPKWNRIDHRTRGWNERRARTEAVRPRKPRQDPGNDFRPFAPFEYTGILAMSSDFAQYPDTERMKMTIAQNLPAGVRLLLTVKDELQRAKMIEKYSQWIDPRRLLFSIVGQDGVPAFWSRDALPYPVVPMNGKKKPWFTVDARYLPDFAYEPDGDVARTLGVGVRSHRYIYVGGNLGSDGRGNCFRVDSSRGAGMPYAVYRNFYGCRNLLELPYAGGIGDVDERLAFLSPSLAVTDTPFYATLLREKGYEVVMLPRPRGGKTEFQTYANFLLVNGTAFLPIYGVPEDGRAIRVLESLNLKVIPIEQRQVSNVGQGNVHCYTMNYPVAPLARSQ